MASPGAKTNALCARLAGGSCARVDGTCLPSQLIKRHSWKCARVRTVGSESLPRECSSARNCQANHGSKQSERKLNSGGCEESMFHVEGNDRHEHIYRQQDGWKSGGKAGDQQQSTY